MFTSRVTFTPRFESGSVGRAGGSFFFSVLILKRPRFARATTISLSIAILISSKCTTLSNSLPSLHLSSIPFRRSPCTGHQV